MLRKLEIQEIAWYQSCLQKRVSIGEVQARKFGRPSPSNPSWQQFLAQMTATDELWQYSSPSED